ncbi:MAG: ATP-binding protein [Pyrobaculum sp.]
METLERSNPWWFDPDWSERDIHLRRWASERVRWIPQWIEHLSLAPPALNFVYGPRQTGKTTGVKFLIKRLLESAPPESVVYVDLDSVVSLREFREAMHWVLARAEARGVGRLYIFLDEVTSLRGWWRVVKFYIDSGALERSVVTATGSSAVELLKTPEKFPGRRGSGRDVVVLPLGFPQFASVLYGEARDPAVVEALFEEYLKRGGFPKSINGHPDAAASLIDAVVSETYRHGRSPQLLKEVVGAIMEKVPSPLSYHAVAQEVGISHNTVREYVEFLRDLYLVGVAYLLEGDKPNLRREKKIFFRDPLIYRALAWWTGRSTDESTLLEHVAQEHLYRTCGSVYYYRNRTEIDIVAGSHRLEIKTSRARRSYPRGVQIVTKRDLPIYLLQLKSC